MKQESIARYLSVWQYFIETIKGKDECDWKKLFEDGKGDIAILYNVLISGNFKGYHKRTSSGQQGKPEKKDAKPKEAKPREVKVRAPKEKKAKSILVQKKIDKAKLTPQKPSSLTSASPVQPLYSQSSVLSSSVQQEDQDDGLFGSALDGEDMAEEVALDESVWRTATSSRPQSLSQAPPQAHSSQWREAQIELERKRRREEEERRAQSTQKAEWERRQQAEIEALRHQQEQSLRERQLEEEERRRRQQLIEEERERVRKELEQQTQTVYINNAENRDECVFAYHFRYLSSSLFTQA
jgi:hypothetical protein